MTRWLGKYSEDHCHIWVTSEIFLKPETLWKAFPNLIDAADLTTQIHISLFYMWLDFMCWVWLRLHISSLDRLRILIIPLNQNSRWLWIHMTKYSPYLYWPMTWHTQWLIATVLIRCLFDVSIVMLLNERPAVAHIYSLSRRTLGGWRAVLSLV